MGKVSGYMEKEINAFISYLHNVKGTSSNTEMSYKRDLEKVQHFMESHGIRETTEISADDLEEYVQYLEDNKFAAATVSRNIASLKAFYHYLVQEGMASLRAIPPKKYGTKPCLNCSTRQVSG